MQTDDSIIDIAISNCVLNLVPDKQRAFSEIHRVLRQGGRFCISDIVSTGMLPAAIREAAEWYTGCVSGAIAKDEYIGIIKSTGFSDVQVAKERLINLPDETLSPYLSEAGLDAFRASGAGLTSVTVTGLKQSA